MPRPAFFKATEEATKHVVFVIYDDVTLVDFVGATEVFSSVPGLKVHWVAPTKAPITTSEKMKVLPTGTFRKAPKEGIEILFIPGGGADGVSAAMFDKRYRKFIKAASARATWTGSVCTGAFVLAAAHGLDNCQATTYWSQLGNLSLLKEKYGITVDQNSYPRYLVDKQRRRFSGGGISSSIDLALELANIITNKETAEKAQLSIQYAPDPPTKSGDPSQAPAHITKEVRAEQAGYTAQMLEAVRRLINEAV